MNIPTPPPAQVTFECDELVVGGGHIRDVEVSAS